MALLNFTHIFVLFGMPTKWCPWPAINDKSLSILVKNLDSQLNNHRKQYLDGDFSPVTTHHSSKRLFPPLLWNLRRSVRMGVAQAEKSRRRRGCFECSKEDFVKGESFENWGNYRRALGQTGPRFKERLFARSDEVEEVQDLRLRSENDMKRSLTWWDLTWFGFGAVIGAGIFVLTGEEARINAGPAIVLSYVVSGLSAMLSVFCYTEFAVEIPVAGGSFAYLRVELGDFAAFIAAANIVLEGLIGGAAVARTWTSYFATLLNHHPTDFRIHVSGLANDYNMLDPIAVVVLALTAMLAMRSTRATSYLNWIATAINMCVILFVIVAAFAHANTENLRPFLPFGPKGVFKAAAVIYFAYGGYDAIATMAEETKNPSRDIPLGLLTSMSAITVIYCLMALALCMMQSYKVLDEDAAFSIAFGAAGMHWAKYLVALGALKGMTTVLMVGTVSQARYITHIARTHMIPSWFALVNEYTGTPINATLVMTAATACVAFFSSLNVLSSLLSISTLFIFMMMAVALLVRRHYVKGLTSSTHLHRLVSLIIVIICSSVATSVYWAVSDGWVGYVVSISVWLAATSAMALYVPQQRTPKVWGVPLVPWLPSLSIAINVFLMGSLETQTFVRFGICTAAMLVYYVLFGLHATYDVAHLPSAKYDELVKPLPPSTSDVENGGESQSTISGHGDQPEKH